MYINNKCLFNAYGAIDLNILQSKRYFTNAEELIKQKSTKHKAKSRKETREMHEGDPFKNDFQIL